MVAGVNESQVWHEVADWIRRQQEEGVCHCVGCIRDEADHLAKVERDEARKRREHEALMASVQRFFLSGYCMADNHVLCCRKFGALYRCTCTCHSGLEEP